MPSAITGVTQPYLFDTDIDSQEEEEELLTQRHREVDTSEWQVSLLQYSGSI